MYANAQSLSGLKWTIVATILHHGRDTPCRQVRFLWKMAPMSIGTIVLIILVLALIGVIPNWPHSKGWGYGPSGGLGLVVVILLILLLMGRI